MNVLPTSINPNDPKFKENAAHHRALASAARRRRPAEGVRAQRSLCLWATPRRVTARAQASRTSS